LVYAIWDTDSANLVGSYDSEGDALADVRDAVKRFGRDYARAWGLAIHDGDDVEKVAEGDELITRALDETPAPR
jgi:hypothetical protein